MIDFIGAIIPLLSWVLVIVAIYWFVTRLTRLIKAIEKLTEAIEGQSESVNGYESKPSAKLPQ